LGDFAGELVFARGAVEKIKKRKRKNGKTEINFRAEKRKVAEAPYQIIKIPLGMKCL